MFKVNEIFTSIQGEGCFTGHPSHFIRFQGCPHACPFCDTKKTWVYDEAPLELSLADIIARMKLLKQDYPNISHVVLTGGEPLHGQNGANLPELMLELWTQLKLPCQIETSGTECPPDFEQHLVGVPRFITASPKRATPNSPFLALNAKLVPYIDELKFLVDDEENAQEEIEKFLQGYDKFKPCISICVQPIDYGVLDDDKIKRTRTARQNAIRICKEKDWTLSAQLHKFLFIE